MSRPFSFEILMQEFLCHLLTHKLASLPLTALVPMFVGRKDPTRAARRLVSGLVRDGLIRSSVFMVSEAIIPPPVPLEELEAGEPGFNFAGTAQVLRTRWSGPRRAETFLFSTPMAVRRHGGHVGHLRNSDVEHDFLLALCFLSLDPHQQRRWRNSNWLEGEGINFHGYLPDAIILGRSLPTHTVLEVGGASYSKEKLERRSIAAQAWKRILY
jgi:hypothetical protein